MTKVIKHGPKTDGRGRPALRDTTRTKFFMKIGCDHRLASAIIGQSGEKIKGMVSASKTFIKLSKKGNFYPGTQHQVLLVGGPNVNSLRIVMDTVMNELEQVCQSVGHDSAEIKFVIHAHAVANLEADNAAQLTQLRALGCKIDIDSDSHNVRDNIMESVVHLSGPVKALTHALVSINDVVQSHQQQDWYLPWGSHWILTYADEMMNRYDKEEFQVPPKGAGIAEPGNANPLVSLCDDVQRASPSVFSTTMAVEVALRPAHAQLVSAGPDSPGLRNIEQLSGAKCQFAPEEDGLCPLTITGSPLAIYSAHLLTMARIVQSMSQEQAAAQQNQTPILQNNNMPRNPSNVGIAPASAGRPILAPKPAEATMHGTSPTHQFHHLGHAYERSDMAMQYYPQQYVSMMPAAHMVEVANVAAPGMAGYPAAAQHHAAAAAAMNGMMMAGQPIIQYSPSPASASKMRARYNPY